MAVLRCKMCGANLSFVPGMEVCECESCGTQQTLPKADDEHRIALYERANHFRRNNDFDKAMGIYEQILNEDRTDAEAYWSIVLCRYGIEYVEDPATHKQVPTINRAQYQSIFVDEDYKEAIRYAGVSQKILFEEEAKTIDEIQKGILEISQKEEPFDVFICYKETDADGSRTRDSVIANDIYHQLSREGLKVFFAAVTLEDKLGRAYEPYIFAALNSAKVMIVLGTKPEYFNAPWVKNEWSRYLTIIKKDPKKILIPAYRDMDPYDLPDEFSFLQAQDMSKIGFVTDLIRGIKKVTAVETAESIEKRNKRTAENERFDQLNSGSGIEPFLKRAHFFIEDGDWKSAAAYFEKVLDMNPECAEAYLGRLLVELEIKKKEDLLNQTKPFNNSDNYIRACRFAEPGLRDELQGYEKTVNDRILNELKSDFEKGESEAEYEMLIKKAGELGGIEGTEHFIEECKRRKAECRRDMIYESAVKIYERAKTPEDYNKIMSMLEQLGDYKDSVQLIEKCSQQIVDLEKADSRCVICFDENGKHSFVSGYDYYKCCDKCFSALNTLYAKKGLRSAMVLSNLRYLNAKVSGIPKKLVRDRVIEIMQAYINSVPGLENEMKVEKVEEREKTAYELEEERKLKEESIRLQQERRRNEIEREKQIVIEKNAMYEYDVQTVVDKTTGGTDSEMIKFVLGKAAAGGWKLHSLINNKFGESGIMGQTVLIFERRIKEEG